MFVRKLMETFLLRLAGGIGFGIGMSIVLRKT
jgi:hypothetical protein